MPIQNSRSRAQGKRNKMEMQEAVAQNHNHDATRSASGIKGATHSPVAPTSGMELPLQGNPELTKLHGRREQMIQSLNSAKAIREDLKTQMRSIEGQIEAHDQSIARTEGALIMLNTLIQEIDP